MNCVAATFLLNKGINPSREQLQKVRLPNSNIEPDFLKERHQEEQCKVQGHALFSKLEVGRKIASWVPKESTKKSTLKTKTTLEDCGCLLGLVFVLAVDVNITPTQKILKRFKGVAPDSMHKEMDWTDPTMGVIRPPVCIHIDTSLFHQMLQGLNQTELNSDGWIHQRD